MYIYIRGSNCKDDVIYIYKRKTRVVNSNFRTKSIINYLYHKIFAKNSTYQVYINIYTQGISGQL